MISSALESPGFESHTDVISLSLSLRSIIFFYIVTIIIINGIYISYNQGIFYAHV